MKRLPGIILIGLVIVTQLLLVLHFTLTPVNIARIPYRRAERAAAEAASIQDQSQEHNAALQEEWRLAGRHVAREQLTRAGMIFAFLLCAEGAVLYGGKKHEDKHKAVA